MNAREMQTRAFAVMRPFLFLRKVAVRAAHFLQVLFEKERGEMHASVGPDEELFETEVETDGTTRSGRGDRLFHVAYDMDVYISLSEGHGSLCFAGPLLMSRFTVSVFCTPTTSRLL